MKTYTVLMNVKSCRGHQIYKINAESPEEAERLVEEGGGEWQSEEIEVTDCDVEKGSAEECQPEPDEVT